MAFNGIAKTLVDFSVKVTFAFLPIAIVSSDSAFACFPIAIALFPLGGFDIPAL